MARNKNASRPGRWRWWLTAAAVIILCAMALSEYRAVYYARYAPPDTTPESYLLLRRGSLRIRLGSPVPNPTGSGTAGTYPARNAGFGLEAVSRWDGHDLAPEISYQSSPSGWGPCTVLIPLWLVEFAAGAAAAWSWRRHRRTRLGCRMCGYPLTGLARDHCPKCGTLRPTCASSTSPLA